MYKGFLHLHDMLRWLVLLSLLVTLLKYFYGWFGKKAWTKTDNILGIVFVSVMDLQVLVGLILYFFLSPVFKLVFSDFGSAMQNDELRFYGVEHITMMLIALTLMHIGRVKSKKGQTDVKKFRGAAIFYLIALVIICAAIPWSRA